MAMVLVRRWHCRFSMSMTKDHVSEPRQLATDHHLGCCPGGYDLTTTCSKCFDSLGSRKP